MSFLAKIFGDANARTVYALQSAVTQINELEQDFRKLSDADLSVKTGEFRARLDKGETPEDILPEAFAAVREAARRTLGQRHFDVQLMGGMVLHQGKIAEMRTGEGKTLVATLPAYLNALTGKGVHVVTVNDYLARRDAVWMGQIYHALGLTVGCINHDASYVYDAEHKHEKSETPRPRPGSAEGGRNLKLETDPHDIQRDIQGSFRIVHEFLRPVGRREAYQADITYGTNNEYGFDYLRDNLVSDPVQMVQREHHFAIVDEVDSILIDEARTPLIISAPDEDSGKLYESFARVVPRLVQGEDYTIDEKLRAVSISESGIGKVEKQLGLGDIYKEGGVRYVHHLEQALKAQTLFKRDKDYVVRDGEVVIVDEFTGRLMPGRRWSEGLHQAVEAKEGVKVQKESRTLATITFQNYFRLYKKLAGMTGTAKTSAEEFHKVYDLDVVVVPTNKPLIRQDAPDRIYKTEQGKFRAVAREVKERHERGQPVLIGTVSIEKNELLSSLLKNEGIPHEVLNAKNHEREGEIIAQAGRKGAVTVATNMAGRGVDIILGGNPPVSGEAEQVCTVGGMHVIGTERHEARRIDDQLRGRSGRQGDPGSTQFFISTEDELIRIFGGDRLRNVMETLGIGEDDVIENRFVSNAIGQAQMRVEGHNFDQRKYVLEYDDVVNKHREAVYRLRKDVLFKADNKKRILEYLYDVVRMISLAHTVSETGEWDVKGMATALASLAPFERLKEPIQQYAQGGDAQGLTEELTQKIDTLYAAHEANMGADTMRNIERFVLLRTIDELWMDHIEELEHLRDSVRLRAYGQQDPLVEYKIEGQKLYERLMEAIKTQVAGLIFKVSLTPAPREVVGREERPDLDKQEPLMQRDSESAGAEVHPRKVNLGRNDPCWCGSGKKFKKCHGA